MQALVYLVEDDPELVMILEERLHAAGHDVESYRNGRDALEAIRQDPDRPDLVLTDLSMPNLSGLELIQQVQEYNPDLYFLVMTAFGTTELEEACLSSGAAGFLRKPFSFHVLLAMIGKLLEEKQLPRQGRLLAEPSALQQSDTSLSASVLPSQAFQPSPQLQEHSDLPIYPFIIGGLLHNALNALMAITSFQEDLSRKMAGSEVDRSLKASLERAVPGTKHLTILLRTMQYITHSFYDKEEKQSVHSQIFETISSFVQEHPEITYHSTVSNALDHVSIPVGVCTFLAGELLKNSTKACATRPGAEIWLTIDVMERINVLSLECHDTGVGFSEDILTKIRAHELRPPKGKEVGGYGLYLIQELTYRLRGDLLVANQGTCGARIQVLLPLTVKKDEM